MAFIVLYLSMPPRLVELRLWGGATNGRLPDPEKIIIKSHAHSGHASAQQLRRVLVGSVGDNARNANYLDEALEQCDSW